MTALPFPGTEAEVIAKTRDADALLTSASPVTRSVMSALEELKVVARTGVGYDVIESLDGPKAQLTEQPFSARPPLAADSRVPPPDTGERHRDRPTDPTHTPATGDEGDLAVEVARGPLTAPAAAAWSPAAGDASSPARSRTRS